MCSFHVRPCRFFPLNRRVTDTLVPKASVILVITAESVGALPWCQCQRPKLREKSFFGDVCEVATELPEFVAPRLKTTPGYRSFSSNLSMENLPLPWTTYENPPLDAGGGGVGVGVLVDQVIRGKTAAVCTSNWRQHKHGRNCSTAHTSASHSS